MKLILIILIVLMSFNLVYAVNVDKSVENKLNNNGEADVIVYLNEQNINAQKGDIRENSIQNLGNEIKLKYKYENLNGFSGKINKNAFEKLKNDPNVKEIYLNKERKIFLQNSLSLINATITRSKSINDLNLTGKGQTICILDTGINYSHNDFGSCLSINNGNKCRVNSGYDYVNNDNDPYDDNGHGTHVAGIAAASGNITGVAPEANLTIIKVCNSAGSCSDGNIIAGFNYCIGNKTKYNINVISLSLGDSSLNTNYCNSDSLAQSINFAAQNNITVTIASGNAGSLSGISAPSCVQNATSVASSNKQDQISSFSNRNSITDIIAPGENINSTYHNATYYSNLYAQLSGTSMSTPHIAGIVALLQQYKQEESNRTLKVIEIENALKNSDKNITDTNGLSYTRVNINKALISIDTKKPTFNIIISPNPANLTLDNISINFTAFDTNLERIVVNLTYPNGTLITSNESNFTLTTNQLNVIGNYNITIFVNDSNGNVNITYYNLQINNPDTPIVTLNSPENNINLSSNLINFNCSFTENINLRNMSLYINSTGNFILNQTNNLTGINNSTNFTLNLNDGNYIWNCLAYDNSTNSAFAFNNFTFRIDTLKPIIDSINANSITANSAIITWTTNEISNSTVYYGTTISTDSINKENNFIISHSVTLTGLTPSTIYFYNISSCDLVNNCNTTIQFNFTTSAASSGGSSGGSGGGGGSGGSSKGKNEDKNEINKDLPINPTTPKKEEPEKIENKEQKNEIITNNIKDNNIKKDKESLLRFTGKTITNAIKTKTGKNVLIFGALLSFISYFYFFRKRP